MISYLFKKRNIVIALIYDIFFIICSWYLSFYLRFNFDIPEYYSKIMHSYIPYIIFITLSSFALSGIYRISWRYISTFDLLKIVLTIISLTGILLLISIFFLLEIPKSIFLINFLSLIVSIGGIRFTYKIYLLLKYQNFFYPSKKKVICYGCNNFLQVVLEDLRKKSNFEVVGILDDDITLHGKKIFGVNVLGSLNYFNKKNSKDIDQLIITSSLQKDTVKKHVLDLVNKYDFKILIESSIYEEFNSGLKPVLREFNLNDLLGRDAIKIKSDEVRRFIKNKKVFISGAGGSIGSELSSQVLMHNPKLLVCFDISESLLYELQQKLSKSRYRENVLYIVGDVKNSKRVAKVFSQYSPDVVYHAAAYKHVPLLENTNSAEALFNNVIGTYNLCKISVKFNVSNFIFVSTDKAVNPTNIMGASKRMAEIVCLAFSKNSKSKINIVRFGNVLGSSGSVIPLFTKQISSGGPITVTDKNISRFFMSIPEASALILQSCTFDNSGNIFILDMGKPIKIVDLAKTMIKLAGHGYDQIKIKYTGLRQGEKLFEELSLHNEILEETKNSKIRVVKYKNISMRNITGLINWIITLESKDESIIKHEILQWVPEYQYKQGS